MARMTEATGVLLAEQEQLETRLAELRRVGGHRTRAGALARVDETMAAAEATLAAQLSEARHTLATRNAPLPLPTVLTIAGLLAVVRDPAVGEELRAAVRRDAGRGESEPFQDGAVQERRDVEARLVDLGAELEARSMEAEAEDLKGRHKRLVDRIGGKA